MKVLIIGFFTRTYMPYIEKYESVFKKNNIEYDLMFFDRDETSKNVEHNNNEYIYKHITTTSRLNKIMPVLKYRGIVKKLIKKNKYDRLVICTTMPAILLFGLLKTKYKNKYIYDYRDSTYENFRFFKKWVNKIVDNSYFTVMSSKGYLEILDKNEKIIFNHNISNNECVVENTPQLQNKNHINIGFLGYIRYFDVNSKIIDALKNDSKYYLTYIGSKFSDCDLEGYCELNNIKNVSILGKYNNDEKPNLYKNIDMINSSYSTNSNEVEFAIPNRLYDAVLFKKPIITTKGTYLSKIVEQYGLGLSIDPLNDDIHKCIDKYLSEFDSDDFTKKCNNFLDEINRDEKILNNSINSFIK